VNNRRIQLRLLIVGALVASVLSATFASATSNVQFTVRGSARQVYLTGLTPGAAVQLLDSAGHRVAAKVADRQGGLIFYDVRPGSGYRARVAGRMSRPVNVNPETPAPWSAATYGQVIPDHGYGYLTTRDGIQLAYTVHPPTQPAGLGTPEATVPAGPAYAKPYPTLIEYSGYGYARESGPVNGIAAVANIMGFAVVDISMRGTGCSGGAFNFFEPLQSLDGYDIIETVARQSWVKGHKVGMMGISYGGISQLFTAALRPPSLAAISPLSVLDASATTLYPGGLLNTGFAVAWAQERQHEALPAGPHAGQDWAYSRIQSGDTACKANQALHGQAQDLVKTIRQNNFYHAAYADSVDPVTFVDKINVPVFLACQFQDEQTGGHCPTLAAHFTGTNKKWFTFTNGAHIDSLDPETYNRWYDFLQLYVAEEAPAQNAAVLGASAPVVYQAAMGIPQSDLITLPVDPIQAYPTRALALTAFEKLPPVRVLFDNGAGKAPNGSFTPGNPYPGYEASFSALPVPGTTARQWYLGSNGALTDGKPNSRGADMYAPSTRALPFNDYSGGNTGGGGLWGNAAQWTWNWRPNPAGTAASYVTAPLTSDATVVGAGAVHLWVRSSTPDVDLQATVSEVAADGHETFVQNGWLRASERKLSTGTDNLFHSRSTLLQPILSMQASDSAPMPTDRYVPVVIPLYYQGHTYRSGTRIRVTIAAPNGTQPIWGFSETLPKGTAAVSIGHSPSMPSSLVLPIVPGVSVPAALPPCPSLRNMPCRPYVALANRPTS
jgi:predicted acyl esterase